MKILVCISKAPDTTSKIAFSEGNTKFDENGVQFIVNPYDEWYALVRALEIKEAGGGQVTIITVGGATDDAVIRKALAIGLMMQFVSMQSQKMPISLQCKLPLSLKKMPMI